VHSPVFLFINIVSPPTCGFQFIHFKSKIMLLLLYSSLRDLLIWTYLTFTSTRCFTGNLTDGFLSYIYVHLISLVRVTHHSGLPKTEGVTRTRNFWCKNQDGQTTMSLSLYPHMFFPCHPSTEMLKN
jgi:hypothetical protein